MLHVEWEKEEFVMLTLAPIQMIVEESQILFLSNQKVCSYPFKDIST